MERGTATPFDAARGVAQGGVVEGPRAPASMAADPSAVLGAVPLPVAGRIE
jgi:hypothetical protein